MNIINFKNDNLIILKEKDENKRVIGFKKYNNIRIIGRDSFYPNVLLIEEKKKKKKVKIVIL